MSDRIRVLAVALCRDGDRVLVERGEDRTTGDRYYRAIGGAVEFGELAADAVVREWREELGLTLERPSLRGVLENLFTYEGRAGHEVAFVFEATIAERWPFERDAFTVVDADGLAHEAVWVTRDDLAREARPLYPSGVLDSLPEPV